MFSGSGALGIESVSRGAKHAICADSSRHAIGIIKANVKKTHLEDKIEIINRDYKKVLNDLSIKKFDIIFLDPPYKTDFALDAIKVIMEKDLLKTEGIIVFETDRNEEYIKNTYELAKVIDIRKYGRVKLIFLGRKE